MSVSALPGAAAAARFGPRAWGLILVLCAALFLDALDVSMVGVALPSIQSDLDMTTSSLQWVISGYVLGFGGFLLLGGRLADLLGRRNVFLIALGVFVVASALGGLVNDGSLLIATRFVKGVSAAFTAPAGLSIITTSFAEGPMRNRALSIYAATGATGFSLGLVFGGLLTEIGWRWVFLLPAPIALVTLIAAFRLVPDSGRPSTGARRGFDLAGAVALTASMLLLVFTVVEAPDAGWASARTLGSFVAVAVLLTAFVAIERRTARPLVRLGILRSASLVRANIGAMSLIGGWFGFQFVATLYMQQLRGWSPLETGLAILPGGLLVALLAPRLTPLITRFGPGPLISAGLLFDRGRVRAVPAHRARLALRDRDPADDAARRARVRARLRAAQHRGHQRHRARGAGACGRPAEHLVPVRRGARPGDRDRRRRGQRRHRRHPQDLLDGFVPAVAVSLIVAVIGFLATTVRRPQARLEADPASPA